MRWHRVRVQLRGWLVIWSVLVASNTEAGFLRRTGLAHTCVNLRILNLTGQTMVEARSTWTCVWGYSVNVPSCYPPFLRSHNGPMAKAPLTCLTNIQKLVFHSLLAPIASPSFSNVTARVRSEPRLLPRRQENTWTLGGAQSSLVSRRIAAFSVGRGHSKWWWTAGAQSAGGVTLSAARRRKGRARPELVGHHHRVRVVVLEGEVRAFFCTSNGSRPSRGGTSLVIQVGHDAVLQGSKGVCFIVLGASTRNGSGPCGAVCHFELWGWILDRMQVRRQRGKQRRPHSAERLCIAKGKVKALEEGLI